MKEFVKSAEFRKLNVGFGLDEGITSPNDSFVVAYGERAIWRKNFYIHRQYGFMCCVVTGECLSQN